MSALHMRQGVSRPASPGSGPEAEHPHQDEAADLEKVPGLGEQAARTVHQVDDCSDAQGRHEGGDERNHPEGTLGPHRHEHERQAEGHRECGLVPGEMDGDL